MQILASLQSSWTDISAKLDQQACADHAAELTVRSFHHFVTHATHRIEPRSADGQLCAAPAVGLRHILQSWGGLLDAVNSGLKHSQRDTAKDSVLMTGAAGCNVTPTQVPSALISASAHSSGHDSASRKRLRGIISPGLADTPTCQRSCVRTEHGSSWHTAGSLVSPVAPATSSTSGRQSRSSYNLAARFNDTTSQPPMFAASPSTAEFRRAASDSCLQQGELAMYQPKRVQSTFRDEPPTGADRDDAPTRHTLHSLHAATNPSTTPDSPAAAHGAAVLTEHAGDTSALWRRLLGEQVTDVDPDELVDALCVAFANRTPSIVERCVCGLCSAVCTLEG